MRAVPDDRASAPSSVATDVGAVDPDAVPPDRSDPASVKASFDVFRVTAVISDDDRTDVGRERTDDPPDLIDSPSEAATLASGSMWSKHSGSPSTRCAGLTSQMERNVSPRTEL